MADPGFSWRREWPWVLLAAGLALAVRWPLLREAEILVQNDNSFLGLMALDIWRKGAIPLFCYGQDYIGTLEAYLAAPFQALTGSPPAGVAASQALGMALGQLAFYPLFFLSGGGRAGALAGSLCLALGTPYQIEYTAGGLISYLSTLVLGAVLLLVGPGALASPRPARLFGLGFLFGLGWWNNPLIVVFIAPVALAAWTRGGLVSVRQGERAPPVSALERRVLALLLGVFVVAAGAALLLLLRGPIRTRLGGLKLSLGHPARYLVRAGAALAFVLALVEWRLAQDRRRWAALFACLAAGMALGASPIALHRLLGRQTGVKAEVLPDRPELAANARVAVHGAREMLLGAGFLPEDLPGLPGALYAAWRRMAVALAALAALVLAFACRRELVELATLRARGLSPPLLATLPAVVLVAAALLRGGVDNRHFLPAWVPLGALVAWSVGGLARRHAGLALAVTGLLLAGQAIAWRQFVSYDVPRMGRPEERRLIETLLADGVSSGYASSYDACVLTYLAGQRLRLSALTDLDYLPWFTREARRAERPVQVFRLSGPLAGPREPAREAAFLARHEGRIETRWRFGIYHVYRYRQVEPEPYERLAHPSRNDPRRKP